MDVQVRRNRKVIQDQENVYVSKTKINVLVPSKRQGLSVRGALGDINTNEQIRRENNVKVAVANEQFEKKTTISRVAKSNYKHVSSKVDTGLAVKNSIQPSSRPPLRREESTGYLAAKAMCTRAALKDTTNKQNDLKEAMNMLLQTRKCNADTKKSSKLPTLKEHSKDIKNVLKPIIKESTQSLQNLKLVEKSEKPSSIKSEKNTKVDLPPIITTPTIPDDIEDIDANDNNSPFLLSEYINDIYKYLIELEKKYPIEFDHMKNQNAITGKMRATLIDWLLEVQKQFSLLMETFHLTVGIIDRYLQAVPNVPKNQLQLVGVTAMYIASKYEEVYAPYVEDFIYVTDNAYSKADLFQCERDINTKLGFSYARPIPLHFLRRYIKAAHGSSQHHHLAKYFVELSLIEYSMAHYNPSELSAAAICLSLHLLSNKPLAEVWTQTLLYYSGYTLEHIMPIIRKLAKIVISVDDSKYRTVYKKYLNTSLAKVASFPQLKGEAIHELAQNST